MTLCTREETPVQRWIGKKQIYYIFWEIGALNSQEKLHRKNSRCISRKIEVIFPHFQGKMRKFAGSINEKLGV